MKARKKELAAEVTEDLKDYYRNLDKELEIYRKLKRDKIANFY